MGRESSQKTEFRILYDEWNLYFGIWAFDDEPAKIVATEMKRDSGVRKGDRIKINIDTFRDKRNAFYFSTNPLGAFKGGEHHRKRPDHQLRLERASIPFPGLP